MSGYIKLWRGWRDNPVLDTPIHRDVWLWLLETAAWKPIPFKVGSQMITLERGQLCASTRQIATACGCSKSAIDRFLTRLENGTMIERQAGQFKNVITICNYAKYQDDERDVRDKSGTVCGTRAGQERDTKEEGKKVKKEEYSEPKGSCASDDALKPEHVWEAWNSLADRIGKPKVRDLTPERRQRLKARIAGYTVGDFLEVMRNIESSAFLRGDKGWTGCTFDWFTKKQNFQKILEGNYNG